MKQLSLSIPKPCHENWEAMTPEDKGRFCGACQKTVVDFSTMSDREIAQFFKKPVGSVCGRFNGSQLNRVVEVPRKRLPWIKYFFGIAVPAFLFAKKAASQGEVRRLLGKVTVCQKPVKTDTVVQNNAKEKIPEGIVLNLRDEGNFPVAFANLAVDGTERKFFSNKEGVFNLPNNLVGKTVTISAVGRLSRQLVLNGPATVTLSVQVSGEVIITEVIKRKAPAVIPLMPRKAVDTASSAFSVYPNPVPTGSSFTLGTKGIESGQYAMAILASSGEAVQTEEVAVDTKSDRQIRLNAVPAGTYFVRLVSRKNNKAYIKTIIVH